MGHMSTDKTLRLSTASSEETEKLGEAIGKNLRGGEIIELASDLGGGKTTFVRGLARGFGSTDRVASPTFTINREYQAGDKKLVHYDFYRLQDPGLMRFELSEALDDPQVVVVIEWADVVQDILPDQRLTLVIRQAGDDTRDITVTAPPALAYLTEGL